MGEVDMAAFWDERARENAAYFVENRLDYDEPDLDRFWGEAPEIVDAIVAATGVRIASTDRIVELGCGIGRLTRVLVERAAHVWALDVSGEMLRQAREHNPQLDRVDWVLCDGRHLTGVGDASADGFLSHVVFQHVPDPAITLGYVREIGRVLRPGGWAAFGVSDDPQVHRRRLRGERHPAWRGSAVDLRELRRVAEEAGLTVERVTGEGTQFCYLGLRARGSAAPATPG